MEKKTVRVAFNVNPLTNIPGGYSITLEYESGSTSKAVNVKHPKKYIEAVLDRCESEGKKLVIAYVSGTNQIIYENEKWFKI